jgi:two-component system cell cycle sensor histidine kinase/response regulator CckA
MPEGGQLTVRTVNVTAEECAAFNHKGMPAADYVMVEVTDTGTGIPPAIIEKIFEPFFSTKEVGKGTGLGLSTVYGIVKQTGGFVYPDSELGTGSVFRIFLPRHIPEKEELKPADAPAIAAISPDRAPSSWSRTRKGCALSTRAGSPRAATPCWKPATAWRRSRCSSSRATSTWSCPTW